MKHIKHKSAMRKAILLCGASMIIALYTGCETPPKDLPPIMQNRPVTAEHFVPQGEVRDFHRMMHAQAASGARADSMLYAYHFDKGELNSLGKEKLALMLDDDDSNNPMTVYLNIAENDEFKSARQDAVVAFLKDQGLEEKQVSFKLGPNPDAGFPASIGLDRLGKTETGGATAAAPGDSSPGYGGTDQPMTQGGGGQTSK
jgi:hypothetical protein